MTKSQRNMLLAIVAMQVVVLGVILVLNLTRANKLDESTTPEDLPVATASPEPVPEVTKEPLSEEELGRMAMEEEEGDHGIEGDEGLTEDGPID